MLRDDQEHRAGRSREILVKRLSENGEFAYVVAVPSGRKTRIHRDTLSRRFTLLHRLPGLNRERRQTRVDHRPFETVGGLPDLHRNLAIREVLGEDVL